MFVTTTKVKPRRRSTVDTARARDREAKRKSYAVGKDVQITTLTTELLALRLQLEADDEAWLQYFFVDVFTYSFVDQQKEMIAAIGQAARIGGDQALAASRGEGKTTIFECLATKFALSGVISYTVLFAANGPKAGESLKNIRDPLEAIGDYTGSETSERLLRLYPEVCEPIHALEGAPQRAYGQTVSGKRFDTGEPFEMVASRFSWCGDSILLPNVPGSPGAGAVIATRGLDGEIRGAKRGTKRVQLAGIDDPDTEETVNSEDQAKKLEKRIDRGIAALGGQRRRVARVMLTTCQNQTCVSYKFTDPKEKPSWHGRKFRFLIEKPTRMDLWQEYVAQRQADLQDGDREGRTAHKFYLDNRKAMEAGAVVSNPHRYDPEQLDDGTRREESALQFYYNEVARIGLEAVETEYDNDPPEELGPVESGITPRRIQKQLSGFDRKAIPDGCTIVTQGIDIRKIALHWIVRAWRPGEPGQPWDCFTVDYGITEIFGTTPGSDEGVGEAIVRALHDRKDRVTAEPYELPIDYTLIDSGYRTEDVYQFCDEAGLGFYPAIGHGRSSGNITTNFRSPVASSPQKVIGWRFFLAIRPNGTGWLVHMDADHWKAWEHDRWMSDPDKPGGMTVFGTKTPWEDRLGPDEKAHHAFARHICAEIEVEEPDKQGVMKRYWKPKSDNNHWFDAAYRSNVAAAMAGVQMTGMSIIEADTEEAGDEGPIVNLTR